MSNKVEAKSIVDFFPPELFAKVKEPSSLKSKKESDSHSDFILIRENGKLRIDGTISDGE